MLFNSIQYIVLLSATLLAYWLSPWLRLRQAVVLLASGYFYFSWSPAFGVMLFGLIVVNWIIGGLIERTHCRRWLFVACLLNLALLAYFKYMNFFLENIHALMNVEDEGLHGSALSIILPLGISFYVFELISYQVDVCQKKIKHERDFSVFAIFVLFFPHLIAGPICRAGQFMPQIHVMQKRDSVRFYNGLYMFVAGLALKAGLADGLANFVNVIFKAPANYSGLDNFLAVLGFGIQILCDFWGYSLMALGAALLFGYVLPFNFNQPYAAFSIRDFWRRWHITLSNWLRDYLYIALGGARVSAKWKIQRNLLLTMLIGGLWHGASWNFILWGGIHGVSLTVNRWFDTAPLPGVVKNTLRWPPFAWLMTMLVVFIAWVFFRAVTFTDAITILEKIVTPLPGWSSTKLEPLYFELLILFLPIQWIVHKTTYNFNMAGMDMWKAAVTFTAISIFTLVYYVDGNDFIYFQF
ncbi:putative membrane protein involved in D-alanine export [Pseudomonas sp. GM50]|uniref:MBOAT family O-acyltransferase n=1 Tax=Pseudomonas sp. GM50 TaxID=1144332 RepID=UPI00027090AE|nr:MBOAT family O-acyltransferase [Pseudomonas sp. GM50]EJM65084.1 putative membrane protein involved in D-alanine export [Pseudomonas sp. GM50]